MLSQLFHYVNQFIVRSVEYVFNPLIELTHQFNPFKTAPIEPNQQLQDAIHHHDIATVTTLLDKGVNPNVKHGEISLLTQAVKENDLGIVKQLLAHHVDTNTFDATQRCPSVNKPLLEVAHEHSALLNAITIGNTTMINLLIESNVDHHLGLTPLDKAIVQHDTSTFNTLVTENPTIVSNVNALGVKPLYFAELMNHKDMINQLTATETEPVAISLHDVIELNTDVPAGLAPSISLSSSSENLMVAFHSGPALPALHLEPSHPEMN